ncbi:MAG: hypothetical protein MK052_08035 [Alphaproteobacteria bacterium]|nr:hypothetical protein [Alphaproteobacteria bacterium]
MHYVLLLIISLQGDIDTTKIEFSDSRDCHSAKREIEEVMQKTPEITLHTAICLELKD